MAEYTNSVGRRKTSVARVYLKTGSGKMTINHRTSDNYLNNELLKMKVARPFAVLGINIEEFDVLVNVKGGGVNGQAEAIRLGIARALQLMNPEWRPALKKEGLLRVDSRQVERKKYGRRKARKRFQFSKR
jgi:small subunit ribosomal protein S9